jgi:ABC-type lipoprotein release transport system permease subunit
MAELETKNSGSVLMVKASTLLETIIAMVIILVMFSLAIGIYNHVLSYSPTVKYEQAKTLCNEEIEHSVNEDDWTDKEQLQDSLVLKKTVINYDPYKDLVLVTVSAFEQDKQIAVVKRIVKKQSHE